MSRRYAGWVGLKGCHALHYFPRDSRFSACGLVSTDKPRDPRARPKSTCKHCAKRAPWSPKS